MRSRELAKPEFDAGWCYRHKNYARIRACLKHSVRQKHGTAVITGASGTGKTFLLSDLMQHQFCNVLKTAQINLAEPVESALLTRVCHAFGACSKEQTASFSLLLEHLRYLDESDLIPLLIIDNAHCLNVDGFEQLQRILQLEETGSTSMLVFLVGRPELNKKIAAIHAEFIRQHSVAVCHLEPFDIAESHVYIEALMDHLGYADSLVITDAACDQIHHYSEGIPGSINRICYALLQLGRTTIDQTEVKQVAELHLVDEEPQGSNTHMSNQSTTDLNSKSDTSPPVSSASETSINTAGRRSLTSVVRMNPPRSRRTSELSERRKQIFSALERDSGLENTEQQPASRVEKPVAAQINNQHDPRQRSVDTDLNNDRMVGVESAEDWENLVEQIRVHTSDNDIPSIYARRDEDRLDNTNPIRLKRKNKSLSKLGRTDWKFFIMLSLLLIVVVILIIRLFTGEDYYVWLQDHLSSTKSSITVLIDKYLGQLKLLIN